MTARLPGIVSAYADFQQILNLEFRSVPTSKSVERHCGRLDPEAKGLVEPAPRPLARGAAFAGEACLAA